MKWLKGLVSKVRKAASVPDWHEWNALEGGAYVRYRRDRNSERVQRRTPDASKWTDYEGAVREPKR